MKRDSAPAWYLLTGLLLGVLMGLFYAWVISPVAYVDVPPDTLQAAYKDHYRAMIALAYAADGNVQRAQARLALLMDEDPLGALAAQAQRTLAGNDSDHAAAALGELAAVLGGVPQAALATPLSSRPAPLSSPTRLPSPTLAPPTATVPPAATKTPAPVFSPTPGATFTPLPTLPPTATPGAPFVLDARTLVCEPAWERALIRVVVKDAAGQPVPGVGALIRWDGTEETFFTGLKPELGAGVADFEMTPGVSYTLVVGQGGQLITDIQAAECQGAYGGRHWGSWMLVFVQP
ncbi:MAG: hypothetical protein Fur0018_23600 [Anaerolineales bacterium]